MAGNSTDKDWQEYGQTNPYWAVLTDERYKGGQLTPDALDHFFGTGRTHMERVFQMIRDKLDPDFAPKRGLDFGCGVGRLTMAMARHVAEAVGVDVAPAMLETARRHAEELGIRNATFVRGDDEFSQVTGTFDFLNSFIVFQHIPYERGLTCFRQMVDRLNPGGCGAIHLLFGNSLLDAALRRHARSSRGTGMSAGERFQSAVTRVKKAVRQHLLRQPLREMQMNPYPLNPIMRALQLAGIRETHTYFTDHGGHHGVLLFFRKADDTDRRLW